ncbi:MAG: TonB-dependent receptor plug domain-containing protein, partial [Candidatus Acidiferrales bacterium]
MRSNPTTSLPFKIILLFIALGVVTSTARPQENPAPEDQLKQLSLEQLANLEVTSVAKAPEQVWKTAAAIFVITQEDIRRSGATSIPEALRLAPGVEVARIDGNKWSIGIRGFGSRLSRSVLVIIDGRNVYSTLLTGTYWEVQDTVMEDIDRIEVIRGPGGTVWGPNAVQGVINIITKSSKDTQGVLAVAGGGDEEQGFASVRYGGNNGNGLSYRVYEKAFNRSAEIHSDGNDYDRWAAVQGGFRVDWNKSTRDAFTLQGDIYDERAGETVTEVNYSPPY